MDRLRQFLADRRGIITIEFAFIGPIFLLMLLSIIELGLTLVTQSLLNGGASDAARAIRVGEVYTASNTLASFQNVLCGDMSMLLSSTTCTNNVVVNVVTSSDGTFGSLSFPTCNANAGTTGSGVVPCSFSPGTGGQAVGVQVSYSRPFIIPWVGIVLSVLNGSAPSQTTPLQATVVFRNEPFTENTTN